MSRFNVNDFYTKKARKEGNLARSVYKLEEIQKKYQVLKRGDYVLDCGYAPGSWLKFCSNIVGSQGFVLGVDIQEIYPVNHPHCKTMLKDILDVQNLSDLGLLDEQKFNCVLSDMAPKTIGVSFVDQARQFELVEHLFSKLPIILKPSGHFVVKIFEGPDSQKFFKENKTYFEKWIYFRPKAVRATSRETYGIGLGYKGLLNLAE